MNSIETAQQLAHSSDRTLFIYVIIGLVGLCLAGVGCMARYLVNTITFIVHKSDVEREQCNQEKKVLNDERKVENSAFVQVVADSNRLKEELIHNVKESTAAMRGNTDILYKVNAKL